MKILYASSEVAPFAASGGLGDVMGALPTAIAKNNHDVVVIAPLYKSVRAKYSSDLVKVADITFNLSWRSTGASIYKISKNGVEYLFVENHYYFDREKLYGEYDDAERFAFFSMAVVEYMLQSNDIPDCLHANDWQCAMAIVYLKTKYASVASLANVKTIYTIHNIEYQGKFDSYILGDVFALGNEYLNLLEFDGCINLMKAAIVSTDYLTTVSPNYARELEYDYYAFGLSGIIASARHKMSGIINGIDYSVFAPNKDKDIYQQYHTRIVKFGKAKNKLKLCEELGLDTNPAIPLLVMITRLASQKGIDIFLAVADELLSHEVQVVVLGTGEPEYENALRALEHRHNNFRALIKFDRVLSKRLYAAGDIFLMPSKSEPCGLAQMLACSYGTVPVVRNVGGLHDTILPYPNPDSIGFRFDNYSADEMLGTILYALDVYRDEAEWKKIRMRAKSKQFTWDNSAKEYINIYENLKNKEI